MAVIVIRNVRYCVYHVIFCTKYSKSSAWVLPHWTYKSQRPEKYVKIADAEVESQRADRLHSALEKEHGMVL
jgi:hypothetical protein